MIVPATFLIALVCAAADARNGKTDVNRRTNALVEQIGFKEDLTVGNPNTRWSKIRRDVTGLRLDDRQRRQRTTAKLVINLGSALQKTRVQIENVARIGFAARRTAQQERQLTIGDGLFGQVIVNNQGVMPLSRKNSPIACRRRAQELHRGRVRGGGCDNDRVIERAMLVEKLIELSDRRSLLADRDIDAIKLDLLVARLVQRFLVEDRVDRNSGLASLAVAMISPRWPRPIGIRASMALRPVWRGSCTDWRSTIPGALTSTRRGLLGFKVWPLPSIGKPSAFTTRLRKPSPTGT